MKTITPGWSRNQWNPCFDAQRSDPAAVRRNALPDPAIADRFRRSRDRIVAERRARLQKRLDELRG